MDMGKRIEADKHQAEADFQANHLWTGRSIKKD